MSLPVNTRKEYKQFNTLQYHVGIARHLKFAMTMRYLKNYVKFINLSFMNISKTKNNSKFDCCFRDINTT